jgi:hypothetical protein
VRRNSEPSGIPDLSLWENYSYRGIFDKQSFLDLDTGKAILIYAYSYLETGEFLAGIGRNQEATVMLEKVGQIAPEMRVSVDQIRMRYGLGR